MASQHLIDQELLPGLEIFGVMEALSLENLAMMRGAAAEMLRQAVVDAGPSPDVDCAERFIPGPLGAPDVRVLVYSPKSSSRPRGGYLHIHGGGYILGVPEMNDAANRQLVSALGCVVVSVDYRLAPETVFPGAVEDCYAALKWFHSEAAALGVDRDRLAIGGESAGGGLAAALALLTRDRGEIRLVHQQLVYPMIDDRAAADPHPFTGEFAWRRKDNYLGWSALLGCEPGSAGVSPYAAASRAENLAGLPPAFISVGALDLFLEEDLDYARRLTRAGVPVELHVYPGAYHGFDAVGDSRLARAHARDLLEALRNALTKPAG